MFGELSVSHRDQGRRGWDGRGVSRGRPRSRPRGRDQGDQARLRREPARAGGQGWLSTTRASASVEPIAYAFPSITFRRQLRDLRLDVIRPERTASSALRSDTRAALRALEFLEMLRAANQRSLFAGLDVLTHEEGFIRLGARSGLHVLLVEEADGGRRPLVFE